jgi:opacity protein-like surface antigen
VKANLIETTVCGPGFALRIAMLKHLWRRTILTSVIGFALLATSTRPAFAQGFISPFVGFDFGGDSGCPQVSGCDNKRLNTGIAFGSLATVLGTELELSYAKDFFGEIPGVSSSVLTVMGNVMLAPSFGPVRPYGVVGLGLIRTDVSASTLFDVENSHFGWDIGGGVMIFPSRHVGIRGDVRYFHAFQDIAVVGLSLGETQLDFGRLSAGVVFRF